MTILRPKRIVRYSFPPEQREFARHFPCRLGLLAVDPFVQKAMSLPLDQTFWTLLFRFRYLSDRFGLIESPKGAMTNLASVPVRLRSIIDNDAPEIMFASVPHDLLCTANEKGEMGWIDKKRRLSYESTNKVIAEAMYYLGASSSLRAVVYEAVTFGNRANAQFFPPSDIL